MLMPQTLTKMIIATNIAIAGASSHPALAQSWSSTNDYPARALREGREGTAEFTVSVNEQGRVEECWITKSSGSPDLDVATCEIISRRARFKPAIDADGKTVKGNFSSRIRWVIPKDDPPPNPEPKPAE